MQNKEINYWLYSSYLSGINCIYIELLYKDFILNCNNVDVSWHTYFKQLLNIESNINNNIISQHLTNNVIKYNNIDVKKIKILQLVNAFRVYGHLNANLDPLNLMKRKNISELNLNFYNFTDYDLDIECNIDIFGIKQNKITFGTLYKALQDIYCNKIGFEYMHILNKEEKFWIQQRIESLSEMHQFSNLEKKRFLNELTAAEGIELYLGSKFPGAKRFSLEGADVLIPMLKEIIRQSSSHGIREIVIGMAHRGRLNVLVNVLGKKPQELFHDFYDEDQEHIITGDVKYHQGFSSNIETNHGLVHLTLLFNPSHLEIISPVVMGSSRARIDRSNKDNNYCIILPITLHGDVAISGQGIVQETLNMSKVSGYDVDGTIHIVINNQIGFTTSNITDIRSSQYCTDIAKMIQIPIFHVNADDLESVMLVTHIALDFRKIFKRDVIIDLVCYRRHGHNESDEPSVTQPIMYNAIKKHFTIRKIYSNSLENAGVILNSQSNEMISKFRNLLDNGNCVVKEWRPIDKKYYVWYNYLDLHKNEVYQSKIDINRLQKLAYCISTLPSDIKIHPRTAKIYHDRYLMANKEKLFDWGAAEMLAYATLIDEKISIRLSGEDTQRGTFFHRHATIYDQENGSVYTPLDHINPNQGEFYVFNSVLSEEATLAFEYGYAITEPQKLIIWEAQFGDFANGAQIVIDQFISSGEQKWGRMCGIVMLLPHGYEGQGPEHSSARLERYLQLCAEQNIQICIPSTPAQIYHMLRRQVLRNIRRPLIVMSPKSLLRHPLAISSLDDMANGEFQLVIGEIDNNIKPQKVKRVILCSGKIYYDLLEERRKRLQKEISIIRIEQLYPFPTEILKDILSPYTHVQDFIWCQEEPQNQGAWYYSQNNLCNIVSSKTILSYVGRPASASTAVGYLTLHKKQQKELIDNALTIH